MLPTLAGGHKFQDLLNLVHLDEEGFYLCKQDQQYFLLEGEDTPTRKVQHKPHVPKVMFLAVVAQPGFDVSANEMFSGKIGIFPFAEQRATQRSSAAGGHDLNKVRRGDKGRYKAKLIEQVIPAVKASWQAARRRERIWAQHDNAPSHKINDDPDIVRECTADGWDIKFISQPANSPDLSILDLGFFNSIQSLQNRTTPRMIDEPINAVNVAFAAQTSEQLGKVWTTLQSILQEIMLAKSDNAFKIPHLKATTERRGRTIRMELLCSEEAWESAQSAIQSAYQ